MKYGCTFPHADIGDDPAVIRDWAQTIEGLGYDFIMIYDHVVGAVHEGRVPALTGPYTEASPFHEAFVTLGFLAAATQDIELTTGVIILPQRQTVLVAKQAAEVDILSGGRLRLGVGVGWNYVEYEALGEDWRTRGARQVEQITLMRRLWTEPVLDFTGRFHRIDRAGILPRPPRTIPIWLGGSSDAAYRRAARLADGFLMMGGPTDASIEGLRRIRTYLDEAGRPSASFGFQTSIPYTDGPNVWHAFRGRWEGVGATHICLGTANGLGGPARQLQALHDFAREMALRPR